MIELTIFDATVWGIVIVSLSSFIIVPLAIRYGTPDKENN